MAIHFFNGGKPCAILSVHNIASGASYRGFSAKMAEDGARTSQLEVQKIPLISQQLQECVLNTSQRTAPPNGEGGSPKELKHNTEPALAAFIAPRPPLVFYSV